MTAAREGRRVSGGGHRTAGGALLVVRDLQVEFRSSAGPVRAVNGVSLEIAAGETVGLVGESGSGKSVTSRAIMGLLPPKTSRVRGSITLTGDELVGLPEKRYRKIRGERIGMVFQDPLTALNPLYRAGEQVAEALRFHFGMGQPEALRRARDLFADVGLPDPDGVVRELCQRAIVLYAGRIAEQAPVESLFAAPHHPYTAGLGASNPQIASRRARLPQIPGAPPNPANIPAGCPFSPRCPAALDRCRREVPALLQTTPPRLSACHRSGELVAGTLALDWEGPAT